VFLVLEREKKGGSAVEREQSHVVCGGGATHVWIASVYVVV
jgi:hypothetical protein